MAVQSSPSKLLISQNILVFHERPPVLLGQATMPIAMPRIGMVIEFGVEPLVRRAGLRYHKPDLNMVKISVSSPELLGSLATTQGVVSFRDSIRLDPRLVFSSLSPKVPTAGLSAILFLRGSVSTGDRSSTCTVTGTMVISR